MQAVSRLASPMRSRSRSDETLTYSSIRPIIVCDGSGGLRLRCRRGPTRPADGHAGSAYADGGTTYGDSGLTYGDGHGHEFTGAGDRYAYRHGHCGTH
jgi:hypothetical protein